MPKGKLHTGKNGGKYYIVKGRKVYQEHRKKSRKKK
jgi:hypothetical protein